MALLRTRRLGFHFFSPSSGDTTLYTAPAGTRAIVHEVVVAAGGAAGQVTVYVIPSGGTGTFWLHRRTMAADDVDVGALQTVLEAGDALHVFSAVAGPLAWASGAQLDLPP